MLSRQSELRLLVRMMLVMEMWKTAASEPQVSPDLMLYSSGGMGVGVGISVGGSVAVGGRLAVAVTVGVGDSAGVVGVLPPVARKAKNMMAAATMITTAIIPTAAGRLKVISGIRLACTDF